MEHRALRRKSHEALHPGTTTGGDVDGAAVEEAVKSIRPPEIRYRSGSIPLEEWLRSRNFRRVGRVARHFFRGPYRPEAHREPFQRFLANVVASGTADSEKLALRFQEMLDPAWREPGVRQFAASGTRWLRAFLDDVPQWEDRLRTWTARVLGGREQ